MSKTKYKDGDIFAIPLENGQFAICHLMCAFQRGSFLSGGTIAFGVIVIQDSSSDIPDNTEFLTPEAYDTKRVLFYTSGDFIKNGDWSILANRPIVADQQKYLYAIEAGYLYQHPNHTKEPLRLATTEDRKIYPKVSSSAVGGVASIILNGDYK